MKPPIEAVCTNLPGWWADLLSIGIGTTVGLALGAVVVFVGYRLLWREQKDEQAPTAPPADTYAWPSMPRRGRR